MTTAIYRNPFTFLEAPWYRDLPGADVVISGIPFDLATSGTPATACAFTPCPEITT